MGKIGTGELVLVLIIFLVVFAIPIFIIFRLVKFLNKSEKMIDKFMDQMDEEDKS